MKPARLRARLVVLACVAAALALLACKGGEEGDRCNPKLSHDECNTGLSCQQPGTCVESYCCPANLSSSTNPFCHGDLCPPPLDAGAPPSPTDGGTNS